MAESLKFSTREIREKEGLVHSGRAPVEDYDQQQLFGDARLEDPCAVDLEFSVGGSSILLEGRVAGTWTLACSRCLSPHPAPLSGEFDETYPLSSEVIDVGEEVRQAIVLSLPERSLCREDCKGLCPRCGQNLNKAQCGCPADAFPGVRAVKRLKR